MLRFIGEHRRFFGGILLAGLALRLVFVIYFPAITDDSRIYANLASNWLQQGVYGQSPSGQTVIAPSDARLPGYPAFLAAVFWMFGVGNFRAVLLAQVLVDLGTCFIVADLARRMVSERAARIAFVLAALCPFLADYAAAVLSETWEIFFTALALDCAVAAGEGMRDGEGLRLWAATGAAIGACILLRPDGGIVLVAVLLFLVVAAPKGATKFEGGTASLNKLRKKFFLRRHFAPAAKAGSEKKSRIAAVNRCATQNQVLYRFYRGALVPGIIVALFALAPLAPWTARNFRTLHHFQPLAPRYANETDELVPRGFNRWVKTWMADYTSVEEIYWNVPGDKIDAAKLPSRAMESPAEREATLDAIDDYNEAQDIAPDLDARFEQLAAERIRAHPIRYYVVLPVVRIVDMWLRPRTEILPPDPRWWEFNDDKKHSLTAVCFGLLNLAYVGAALWAIIFARSPIRWAGLLVGFLLLRSAFLGTLENPEPRYTLEGYPAVIVMAAAFLANASERQRQAESHS